jgi:hypothetical protein
MKRSRSGGYVGVFTWVVLTLSLLTVRPALAQQISATGARSNDGLWRAATDQALPAAQRRADLIGPYAVVQLNRTALNAQLALAPNETDASKGSRAIVVTLPLPDGRFSRFRIEESPILAPDLAAAFPEIKTYSGAGLDDPTATARLDITQAGFHAMILAAGGTVYIDPYAPGDLVNHVAYDKTSLRRPDAPFRDLVLGETDLPRNYNEFPILNGTTRRTYRLALAANYEYVMAAGGTQAAALARMITSMNRVNGIYERELAVRLTLMTGTSAEPVKLISLEPGDYANVDGLTMLGQNQTRLDAILGNGNYDIGHVFSTGGGGIAALNAACSVTRKAQGVTGSSSPVGDAFDVDYVAHEMGHQFGANHTFNGTAGNCSGGNRSAAHAYEVGSGSTIMGYAGICAPEDTQLHSDDLFNFESLNEITTFITDGGGATCGGTEPTGNTLPVVTLPAVSYNVPKQTPFTLTATATDADFDALTYIWEEHDLGSASFDVTSAATDAGNRPLFRSYAPTATPWRTFPSLPYILNNANAPPRISTCERSACVTGEVLPSLDRTMSFEVTVRDNRAGGGAVVSAATQVTVVSGIGPFAVVSPNSAVVWPGGSAQTVTWSVNGANALAANVKISLSTNGGLTFPITLNASTPNDGSEIVVMPNVSATTRARIKVEAVGNIFFDISDTNFTISAGPAVSADVAIDFGPTYGLWLRYNATGALPLWSQLHYLSPSVMAAGDIDGNGISDLVVDFPGAGLWIWMNNSYWVFLHPLDVDQLVVADLDGNGQDEIILNFPGAGIWIRYNNTAWSQLHGVNAAGLAAGNVDGDAGGKADLIVNFPGFGVWMYLDNLTWVKLHPDNVTDIQTGDLDGNGQDEIVLNFPGQGIWVRVNNSSWFQLHDQNADGISIGDLDGDALGQKDVIINFPGSGIWAWMNNSSWNQLNGANASAMASKDLDGNGKDDLMLTFPGSGVLVWMNNTSYGLLHPIDGEAFAIGRLDSN